MIRFIRPLATCALLAVVPADAIPSTDKIARFAGVKDDNGEIKKLDVSADAMPTRNGQLEVIGCIELGADDDGCKLYAVMIQKDEFDANLANLAIAAVDYMKAQKAAQFTTGAVALIGSEKGGFIGARWTTMLVREGQIESVEYDLREIGQVSFVVDKATGDTIAFDAKSSDSIVQLNANEISYWMNAGAGSIVDAAGPGYSYDLKDRHIAALTDIDGAFLRRSRNSVVVISDGKNNAAFNLAPEGHLEYKGFFEGAYEYALDEAGEVNADELIAFTGNPDTADGLRYKRMAFDELPQGAREVLAA